VKPNFTFGFWFPTKAIDDAGLSDKITKDAYEVFVGLASLASSPKRKPHPDNHTFTWILRQKIVDDARHAFADETRKRSKLNRAGRLVRTLAECGLIETQRGGKDSELYFRVTETGGDLLRQHNNYATPSTKIVPPHIEEQQIKEQTPPGPQGGRDSELILRIQKLFKPDRTAPFPFNKREQLAYTENLATIESTSPEEWDALERWYKVPCDDSRTKWRTQSPLSLLRSWEREIKRALDDLEKHPPTRPRPKRLEPPDGWEETFTALMGWEDGIVHAWERIPDCVQREIIDATKPACHADNK